jgi:hypothetical protein
MFGALGDIIVDHGAIRHEDASQIKARDGDMGEKMVQMFESTTWLVNVQDTESVKCNGRVRTGEIL